MIYREIVLHSIFLIIITTEITITATATWVVIYQSAVSIRLRTDSHSWQKNRYINWVKTHVNELQWRFVSFLAHRLVFEVSSATHTHTHKHTDRITETASRYSSCNITRSLAAHWLCYNSNLYSNDAHTMKVPRLVACFSVFYAYVLHHRFISVFIQRKYCDSKRIHTEQMFGEISSCAIRKSNKMRF